ncbi:lasso peptide biosynthesis B2 protein [Cupriavidus pauculus]|nr:lasso peptide biosynthesis B2 protein [Cupriavidus pauculus]
MPFHFRPHIRVASCERDLVILNLQTDTYQVVMDVEPDTLNASLGASWNAEDTPILRVLREIGAVQESVSTYDQVVPVTLSGFCEQRWMFPAVDEAVEGICRLGSLIEVLRAGWTMKRTTLGRIAGCLSPRDAILVTGVERQIQFQQMAGLMRSLNRAFVWDLSGNKCLTYSYALVRLARRLGIPAKLVVGVRTRPFFSHAWVELHGEVVSDTPTLRQSLAVILEA